MKKAISKVDLSKAKKRYEKELDKLNGYLFDVPLLGFNSGGYDIKLIKNDLFAVIGDVKMCIKNPSYMCISADGFKMLDIMNYCPAGTSYDSYLKTYLGGCKCDDKIRCTCGLTKGVFPYEYIDSFDKLYETELPPKEAFDSSLRGTSISDEEYNRVQFVWQSQGMKTLKDLLIWYNNLDVAPFVQAVCKHRVFFRQYELDMFVDGVSLPGLAEKVMYKTCYGHLETRDRTLGKPFEFNKARFDGYRGQDTKAGRECTMSYGFVQELCKRQKWLCGLCYIPLTAETASVDRVNNKIGHTNRNIMISCKQCNVARKDMSIDKFRHSKLVEYNHDKIVFSIDEEQKDIYAKMKANIVGGPSIIFNRYAKRNETYIRNGEKLVKKVIGYDANALYLWCLGNQMPCGRLTTIEPYEGIMDDIKEDKLFGFIECDIRTPENLKGYFSEMTPIFKNIEIDPSRKDIIGEHMYEFNIKRGQTRAKKAKKLIGSYFGEKILIYTPLLKWYLEHGLEITKIYSFVKCVSGTPFKRFADAVSDARRQGDVDKSKSMIADQMKLIGNSAFGRSGMDMSKHKLVIFEKNEKKVRDMMAKENWCSTEELEDACEITLRKRMIKLKNPIHVSIAIYQLAKLRMLQFYYDCIDFYFDRSDFEYQEMDTDSGYIAFSCENPFEECIKPHLREHFEQHKYDWFPRDDTKENAAYDKRTPGLFKEEWRGNSMTSLSSKNYICSLPDDGHKVKISSKGIQGSNDKPDNMRNADVLNSDAFEKVVKSKAAVCSLEGTNKGFRFCKMSKTVVTYECRKTALSYYYDKRKVLPCGIRTVPLDL